MKKHALKIGDEVMVKSREWYEKSCNNAGEITDINDYCYFKGTMSIYCGRKAIIRQVYIDKSATSVLYNLDIDNEHHWWCEAMLDIGIKNIRKLKMSKLDKKINSKKRVTKKSIL